MKIYKSLYENSMHDVETPDITYKKKNLIFHDPNEDYLEAVNSIIITDLNGNWRNYLNLEKDFGGSPRLNNKGKFKESYRIIKEVDCKDKIQKRFESVNNKKSIRYFTNTLDYGFIWRDQKPILVKIMRESDPYSFSKGSCSLLISAKKWDLNPAIKQGRSVEKDRLKSMNVRLEDMY